MNDGYRNLPAINQGGVFGTPATILPVDASQEFPILSSVEAEYGRNAGAIVNIVTQVGHQRAGTAAAFEYFRNERPRRAQLLQPRAAAQERVPQPPVRRLARRPDRQGQDLLLRRPTKASARTAASRAPAGPDGRRARGRDRGERRRRQPRDRAACSRAIRGRRRTRPADDAGNNLSGDDSVLERRRQPDRQDRPPLRDERPAHRALLLRQQRPELSPRPASGGRAAGLQHRDADDVQTSSRPRSRTSCRRSCCVELRGGYNRFHEDFFPEDGGFDPGLDRPQHRQRPAELRAAADRASATTRRSAPTLSVPRGRVDTNWQVFANVSYTAGRHTHEARLRVPPHARRPVLRRRLPRRAELRQPRRLRGRARRRRPAGARRLEPRDVPEQPRLLRRRTATAIARA